MSSITILMPVFNEAENIYKTVLSIQAQTYSDWTLIIHDNSSTDETYEIAREIAGNDFRIYVYKSQLTYEIQDNWKQTANIALNDFESGYLIWMGGDDLWSSSTFLEKKVELLVENPKYSCVSSAVATLDSFSGSAIRICSNSNFSIVRVFHYLFDYRQINVLWALIPRETFVRLASHPSFKLGGFRGFDWYFGLGLFYFGKVGFDPESDYLKRIRLNPQISKNLIGRLSIGSAYLSFMQPYIENFWNQRGRLRGLPRHILAIVIMSQLLLSHLRLLRLFCLRSIRILSIRGQK
jgi:glycosyltransferase involved in cell wall biosynthesis